MALPQVVTTQGVVNWPPIDPADLALKDNPASPGGHAMILFRESVADDPHASETEYFRIKIFDEEGKDYANVEIPYQEKQTQVGDIQARTIQPDGSVTNFQGQVFDQYVVKLKKLKYRAKVFTLPDVQAGSIIEYTYRVYWHQDVPEVIKNPEKVPWRAGYVYSWRTLSWNVQQDLFTRRAHFVFRPFPKAHLYWYGRAVRKEDVPQKKPDGSLEMEITNFPGFQEEDLMPPEPTVRGHVDFSYLLGGMYSEEGFWNAYSSQTQEAYKPFFSKHKQADRVAAQTVNPADPPEVKLRKLYERSQKVRFLTYEHSRTEQEIKQTHLVENKNVDDILEHGYANRNEVNFLFAALAQSAGLDAAIVRVAARDRTFFSKANLDPSQLNAVVVAVHAGDKDLYLDPATYLCPFPLLPWAESGAGGIRISWLGGGLVTTTAPKSEDAVLTRKASLQLGSDGALAGKLEAAYTGQMALSWRLNMREEDAAGKRKALEHQAKEWLPSGATATLSGSSGWETPAEPLRARFNVTIPNEVVKTPRRILLPLAVSAAGEPNRFHHAARVHSVYLHYPFQEEDDVTLELPTGYEVESLPKARKLNGPGASYELSSEQAANAIVVKRRLTVNETYYRVEQYSGLRLFFNEVKTGDQDRAVLRLAQAPAAH